MPLPWEAYILTGVYRNGIRNLPAANLILGLPGRTGRAGRKRNWGLEIRPSVEHSSYEHNSHRDSYRT